MTADIEMLVTYAALGVTFVGALGIVSLAWWRSKQKGRRLAAVYERLSSEPPTVTTRAVTVPAMRLRTTPREPFLRARDASGPRSEELRRAVERSIAGRRPTRMNIPASRPVVAASRWQSQPLRPRDDADDDVWLRRSLDVQVSAAPSVGVEPSSTVAPEPTSYVGGGGAFGGAGASGAWDAPAAPGSSVDTSSAYDSSSGSDGGSFGSDP